MVCIKSFILLQQNISYVQELIQYHRNFCIKNPQKQDKSTCSKISKTLKDVCVIGLKIKRLQLHLQMTRFKQFPYSLKGIAHFCIEQDNSQHK